MDARLIRKLLQCVQTPEERVIMTATLQAFCAEHPRIGRRKGQSLYLSASDKDTLAQILRSAGINPATSPDAWQGKTRAEAMALGADEKLTHQTVKRRRVAVKALRPDAAIDLGAGPVRLPARCHADIDYAEVTPLGHDWLIVVENWEAFQDIHVAADQLTFPGNSPLVVWRGDTSDTRADAMLSWITGLSQPVAAFVDYDPTGLVIAGSLPRLAAFVAPPLAELGELLRSRGLHDRFQAQLPTCQRALDDKAPALLRPFWDLIRREGKALPQEQFLFRKLG
jgi:hypothetical protein